MITKEQKLAVINSIGAIKDTIANAGHHGAPEGVLYAAFMAHGVSLDTFTEMIDYLVNARVIRREGHLLFKA